MNTSRLFLLTGLLALTACGSSTTPTTPVTPTPTQTAPRLGMVEIEFSGIGTHLQATARSPLTAQDLTDQPCVVIGAPISSSTADFAGKRYLQATFPVTNTCTTTLQNLTYVAARRLGNSPTLDGSAITSMQTFGGTNAALNLASQILPTQPVYLAGKRLNVEQTTANLQVFDDTAGGELDGLQAQVDPDRTSYDLLPYGFVATSEGSRVIPVGGTGEVTIALSVPIQPNAAQDVFKFRLLTSAATNTLTTITQSLEEQDAAGKAAVEARAAALPGAALRALLGSTITPATVAKNSSAVCQVRAAGPRSAPTATLLDRQGTFRVSPSAPTGPITLGGINLQPSATFTVDGVVYATAVSWTSLTPSILSVNNTSSLVDPVGTFPLQRQTGTLQGSACGQTATVPVPVSPFTSLATAYHTLVVQSDGTVAGWGRNDYGQLNIPAGLTGIVAVAGGQAHSVALKSDGTVVTWGDNRLGELNVPAGLNSVVGISVGALHTLAVKSDGTVAAWGFSNVGETNVPAGLSGVVAVSAGNHDSLALKSDGTVVGWGYNYNGRTNIPAGLTGVIAISAGNYSMALKSDGTVVVWGDNGQSQPPAGLSGVVAVSTNSGYCLALKANGTVVAWGTNDYGQTAVPAGLNGVVAISAGQLHAVALKSDGTVVAWGNNGSGQTSVPTGLRVMVP